MSDVEDVTFLPGATNSHKKALYEPEGVERCKQYVCSQRRAILVLVLILSCIVVVATIAALARPIATVCSDPSSLGTEQTVHEKTLTTEGNQFPWNQIRLPQTVFPLSYDLTMHPNLTTFQFAGRVQIVIATNEVTDFIVFHSKGHEIVSIKLREDDSSEEVAIESLSVSSKNQLAYLKISPALKLGVNYTLDINFTGIIASALTGFYRSSYKTKSGEQRWLATTHFEPTDARAAFPCFDEPQLKATFSMKMTREARHISLFNTRKIDTKETIDGLFEDVFEESVKMSTYLVAFVVCDYDHLSNTTKSGVKVSVYAPPEQIQQASYALEAATSILDYYESFFGVKYPMPKQDLIAIPDFAAGAMENWGLITYRMTALLYDPEVSSASNKQWVAIVVAHELAHQWFGNLVTMKWWNDLWLNEGFASYTEYLGTDHKEPHWNMLAQFIPETMVSAMYADSRSNSHAISVSVHDPAQISEIFDHISYGKGSSIIRMMESFIGRDVLQKGLQAYLIKHQFSNAETQDLWDAMSEATKANNMDIDVGKVMDTWTLQMGYPVVNVTREGSKLKLEQERFLLNPRGTHSVQKSPFDYTWHVPVLYITDQDTQNSNKNLEWMSRGPVEFDLPAGFNWYKLNAAQKGFYRVHYGDEDWTNLIQLMHMNHLALSDADRANLLDDAFSLSQAGYIDVIKALELTKYLINEKEYVPWSVGLENLQYIGMMLEDKPSFKYYATYVKGLMKNMLTELGFANSPTDSQLQKYLRALLLGWAVRLNDETTVEQAKQMYESWMQGSKIPPDLKNVVFRGGIQYGTLREWDFAWASYKNSTVPTEKRKLLYAMASTTNANILSSYLHMALDEEQVRRGDTVTVVSNIAANSAGRVLAWRFVKKNWSEFMARYGTGSFDMATLILRTTSKFSTTFDKEEVEKFFHSNEVGSGKLAVQQTLESIEKNIDWLKQNYNNTVAWLKKETNLP